MLFETIKDSILTQYKLLLFNFEVQISHKLRRKLFQNCVFVQYQVIRKLCDSYNKSIINTIRFEKLFSI